MPKKLHLPARDVLTCQFQDDVSSYPSLTVQSSWSNSPRLATWHLQVCLYRLPIAPRRDGPLLVGPLLPVPWPDSWFRCQAQPHNRRIKGTYSTWRYKSVRLPTGAPREQQLHSTYHLRGSVSLVKPSDSVNSKKLFALKRIGGGIWSFNVPFVLEGQRRLAWCYIQRCILSHAMRPLKNTCQKTFHPMQHSFLMMKDTIIPRVHVQHALPNKILHLLYWKTEQYSQLDENSFPSSMQMQLPIRQLDLAFFLSSKHPTGPTGEESSQSEWAWRQGRLSSKKFTQTQHINNLNQFSLSKAYETSKCHFVFHAPLSIAMSLWMRKMKMLSVEFKCWRLVQYIIRKFEESRTCKSIAR